MATGNFKGYGRSIDLFSLYDLVNTYTVHAALVTSAYVPNVGATSGHFRWSDVSANEIAAGNGYSAGGVALSSKSAAATVADTGKYFTAADFGWSATGGSIPAHRYLVYYVLGTVGGVVNPLVGYQLGDSTGIDVPATSSGNPLTYDVQSTGIFAHVAAV